MLQRGYTLIELMIIMFLIAIIAAIAFPAFDFAQRRLEASQFYPQVRSHLAQARQLAASGVHQVVICGASRQEVTACDGRWIDGMLSFYDMNSDERYDPKVDRLIEHTSLNITYGDVFVKATLGNQHVVFKPNTGFTLGFNGSVYYCGNNPKFHRALILRGSAAMRLSPDKNNDGIREDSRGRPLTVHCDL